MSPTHTHAPQVREAGGSDIPELIRLAEVMFSSVGVDADRAGWRDHAARVLAERLGSDDLAAFVVEDDESGRLVACGAATVAQRLPGPGNPSGRVGYVQWMVTEEGHRRRGLARAVMGAILDWYRGHRVRVVELHASSSGEGLYRSLGFESPPHPQLRLFEALPPD